MEICINGEQGTVNGEPWALNVERGTGNGESKMMNVQNAGISKIGSVGQRW